VECSKALNEVNEIKLPHLIMKAGGDVRFWISGGGVMRWGIKQLPEIWEL
jgi:hypothetical protein